MYDQENQFISEDFQEIRAAGHFGYGGSQRIGWP